MNSEAETVRRCAEHMDRLSAGAKHEPLELVRDFARFDGNGRVVQVRFRAGDVQKLAAFFISEGAKVERQWCRTERAGPAPAAASPAPPARIDSQLLMASHENVHSLQTPAQLSRAVAGAAGLVVVKAGASWCAPCQRVGPDFYALAKNGEFASTSYFELDVSDKTDEAGAWAAFRAMGGQKIPFFAFYKGGAQVGALQSSDIGAVKDVMEQHAERSLAGGAFAFGDDLDF
jgi:thiol-disulfide isomerase/thioredoxin